jgi:hypothetical protein
MSNLNNVYPTCPALMSDGRSQTTDYKSHNLLFKNMKGSSETSYAFREKLQTTGLKDLQNSVLFNMCTTAPGGDITIPKEINLEIYNYGSYLDAFKPLSSISFFK